MEETSGDYRPRYCPQLLFVVRNLSSTLSQYGTKDGGARSVPRVPTKVFGCNVISQTVHISLRRRPLVAAKGTASTSIRTSLLVLLHSINSPRRFRNGWRSAQNDDPGHPHPLPPRL